MASQECGNTFKGMVHVYVSIHRHGVKHKQMSINQELGQPVKVLFQLEGAGDEGRELVDKGLELVVNPSSKSMQEAAADGDDGLGLEV